MKFCILCVGSHGDIRPYVALGIGLKAKGHDVWIASHKKALPLCQKYGLDFKLVDGDLTELITLDTQEELKGFLAFKIMKAFKESLNVQLPTSLKAVQGADFLIYSTAAFAGPHLAEFLNIPSILMQLQPEISTKLHASILFPNQKKFKQIGHFISEQLFWQPIRTHINRWRTQHLNIRKMHFLGPKHDVKTKKTATLIAFSRHLVPPPEDWGEHIQMTNFCRIQERTNWSAPQSLEQFLESDPSTIYVGFGSLTEACHKSTVKKIIDVLIQKKCRSIVQANLPGLNELSLPSYILPIEYAPHDWLFPRVKAVIHHGGVGTIAAGLYAGKPTLVMPFAWDQFFWGKMIADLIIGPKPLPINQFSSETFSTKIDLLLSDSDYEKNALKMMHQLNSEPDGVDMSIEHIMNIVSKGN